MLKKTKTTGLINTINEILSIAKERKIIHLFTQDEQFDGRTITIDNRSMVNFGSCSYLGLETDSRLKKASINAIERYGTQFSSSRTYVSFTLYKELEELLSQMFQAPLLLSQSTSMGHQGVLPIIIDDYDAVVLDHQAHYSMQSVVQNLQIRGITITSLRHSRLDELQVKINELSHKHEKIWYIIDGVYSMYGDLAPIEELIKILDKNKKLHLYVDDAHGMSWAGKNGTGNILGKISLHPRMVLATSLAKGFGSAGGIFIFPNEELLWKVKHWGGPLTHSGPQQPSVVGASIASAKIHLSDEIYERQHEVIKRFQRCNEVLRNYDLPLIGEAVSPIFFIGLGLAKVGYNMVRRMVDSGFYVNLGVFPAVPENCAGIRFTINLHHSFKDIEKLGEAFAYHLPKALEEEERTISDIYRSFKQIRYSGQHPEVENTKKPAFKLRTENSIQKIEPELWNSLLGDYGSYDWNGMAFLEETFKNNEKKEHNWEFYYYIIYDRFEKPVIATFFTALFMKDDMLSPAEISKKIESRRKSDPYYLCSRWLTMGSLITTGQHLYLDRKNPEWKSAMMLLLDTVWQEQDRQGIDNIMLRDFEDNDLELRDFLTDQGFIKTEMPDSHIYSTGTLNGREDYIQNLTSKKRNLLKNNALKFESLFEVEIIKDANESLVDHWYQLYENVSSRNFEINGFKLPRKMFSIMAQSPNWECLQLSLKEEKKVVGVMFNYKRNNYFSMIAGMDYDYLENYKIYKQMLFQTILRAIEIKAKKINLGLTASLEKRKLGAESIPLVAYLQMKDNFNLSLITLIPNTKEEANN